MTYFRLTDLRHKGMIVRAAGEDQAVFRDGRWVDSAIMIGYFSDESPTYDCYEEISESEAMRLVAAQEPAAAKSARRGSKGA